MEGLSHEELYEELYYALSMACREGAVETVTVLLDLGLNVDGMHENGIMFTQSSGSPLLEAVASGYAAVVELLLDRGANANLDSAYGTLPIIRACEFVDGETVRLLLDHGAVIDGREEFFGHAPIHYAVMMGTPVVVELLCVRGADLELLAEDPDDGELKTPLMFACCHDDDNHILEILLENEADPNARNNLGRTALMYAAENASVPAVRTLLRYGANPFMKDNSGERAMEKAADKLVRSALASGSILPSIAHPTSRRVVA